MAKLYSFNYPIVQEKMINIIKKYDIVSFDLFDTLIKRNVMKNSDIFEIVQKKYNNETKENIYDFKKMRKNAELKCETELDYEFNIDEIYERIDGLSKKSLEKLKKLEIETEIEYCQLNLAIAPIYEYCRNNKVQVILTTDMYLPKTYIKKILDKCNINYYSKLYLSNEINKSKRKGNVFKYIVNDLRVDRKNIIHIGDANRADFLSPYLNKITAIKIPVKNENLKYLVKKDLQENFEYRTIEKFISNNINNNNDKYYDLGFEVLGPTLYGFCSWLKNELDVEDFDNVFFLAREGIFIKKCFEILYPNEKNKILYVSRRSIRECRFYEDITLPDLLKILKLRTDATFGDLLDSLNINKKIYNKNELDKEIDKADKLEDFFYANKNKIIKNSKDKRNVILKYLKENNCEKKIALVDVGWEGTMQNGIIDLLNKSNIKNDITGFYFAKSNQAYRDIKIKSYLSNSKEYDYMMLHSFLNLFESFFLPSIGSTIGYEETETGVKPILKKYEYNNQILIIFFRIQKGCLDFLQNVIKSKLQFSNNPDVCLKNIIRLGINPKIREVNLFENIQYEEMKMDKFVNINKRKYLFNPKLIYSDFMKSRWKIGFLKKIFIISANYYKLYKKMKDGSK